MYLIFVSTRIFYRKVLSKSYLIVETVNWQKGKNWLCGLIDLIVLLTEVVLKYFCLWLILTLFFLVRAPPQIRRPNREVRPLRKEMPGGGARGPVGRAHPISKSEKPSTSRDKDCRARGRDDKASLPLPDSFTLSPWPLVHIVIFVGFSEDSGFNMEEI